MVAIRLAQASDLPAISALDARLTGSNKPDYWQEMLAPERHFLVAESDKTVLMGAEHDHLTAGDRAKAAVDTPLGRLGLYCCMEGVISEPARCLALDGAQVLCNWLGTL